MFLKKCKEKERKKEKNILKNKDKKKIVINRLIVK
jgi:hypothetical protein